MKIFWYIVLGILGLSILVYAPFALISYMSHKNTETSQTETSQNAVVVSDYKNIAYTINGQKVLLVNGSAESEAAPGSTSMIQTEYFGNELHTDLNGDGKDDVVFVLVETTGGTGEFYYVVGALATNTGYKSSEAFFLGDRITPQSIDKGQNNQVVVNYADRPDGEPFSTPPSVDKSDVLQFDATTMQFTVVTQNSSSVNTVSSRMLITTATYSCDNDKTITASYYDGPQMPKSKPGEPPVPTGSVDISLDGGVAATLMQTISGSGVRYANSNESFVFWNKGNEAIVMRDNNMDTEYTNCVSQ